MGRKRKLFAVLPTMLTLGNAACGFGSITFAAKVGPEYAGGNHLLVAAMLIFLGMVFDMFDGYAARLANQTSEFGAELDSLCDAISFGVAPAFLMLQFSQEYQSRLLWVIAALFVVCAVLRLARFNVETEEDDSHEHFSGLPSPAAAGTVASFPIAFRGLEEWLQKSEFATNQNMAEWIIPSFKLSLPVITLAVGCLMVSRIHYPHVFNQWFRGNRSRKHVIQLVFTLAAVYLVREMALPLIFCIFAFFAPIQALWKEVGGRWFFKAKQGSH